MINKSLNNKNYATFDFDNYSERGLQSFVRELMQAGAKVASVTASNRKTKKDGLYTKKAEFYFDNGQRAAVLIGDAGDIITLKVNGKDTPYGQPKDTKAFANTIEKLLSKGQVAFDKSLAKKLKSVKLESDVKPISTSTKGKVEETQSALDEAKSNYNIVMTKVNRGIEDKQAAKAALDAKQKELEKAIARTQELRKELRLLESQQ